MSAGDLVNATNRARVGGGFTALKWDGQAIGFVHQLSHTSGRPVAQAVPIHPIDERYAVEIITPAAMGPGTINIEMFEMYGQRVWDRIALLTGAVDIVDIFNRVANSAHPISVVKYIKPPKLRGKVMQPYTEEYHNCIISDITDGETIDVTTMQILKGITIMYTHVTRGGRNDMLGALDVGTTIRDSTSTTFG